MTKPKSMFLAYWAKKLNFLARNKQNKRKTVIDMKLNRKSRIILLPFCNTFIALLHRMWLIWMSKPTNQVSNKRVQIWTYPSYENRFQKISSEWSWLVDLSLLKKYKHSSGIIKSIPKNFSLFDSYHIRYFHHNWVV